VPLVVATGLVIGAFFAFIVAKGLRAQRARPVTGAESLVGQTGVVRSSLDPEGTVWVAGELWTARAEGGPLATGEWVQIVAVDGLRLCVRPSAENTE
jgi:membrane-bound serine protease (ClpP class)